MKRPNVIFFDIDDTLLNNTSAERDAAAKFYKLHRKSLQIDPDEFVDRWHTTTEFFIQQYICGELSFQDQRRERLRQIFGRQYSLSNAEADAIFESYLEFYERSWRLFSDVPNCLDALADFRLGIISNGNATQQRQKLDALGIIDRFTTIVISGEAGVSKPDPGIFKIACRKAGAKPDECWHIGDNLSADVQGSISAGLNGVWLNRNGASNVDNIPTVASLNELTSILDGLK